MIDQLKADLVQRGVTTLPKAWQFVHIDVPQVPDGGGPGKPPTVKASPRGTYVPMAPPAASFQALTSAVAQKLAGRGRAGLLATWLSDPKRIGIALSEGAGQNRSVGRIATLSQLAPAQQALNAALDDIFAHGTAEELVGLAKHLGADEEAARGNPIVLVVSSMAGGSGASMVLDVCRLLSQLDRVETGRIAVFLYTSEIFDRLPPAQRSNVAGNALAMLGELVATQTGAAAEDDAELFAGLDVPRGRENRGVPFQRVFPVGAKSGQTGALFAEGRLEDIYRGIGRGLAALVLSSSVTKQWTSYDLTNATGPGVDREDFGWGAGQQQVLWGSFGFAQLSLGRERYAEYAAQRLARECLARLLDGHLVPGATTPHEEQLTARVVAVRPEARAWLGLPAPDVKTWFETRFTGASHVAAQNLAPEHIDPYLAAPAGPAQQWLQSLMATMANSAPRLRTAVDQQAYSVVHGWYGELLTATENAVAALVGREGIPVAQRLLEEVGRELDGWTQQMRLGAQQLRREPTALSDQIQGQVRAMKGSIDPGNPIVQEVRKDYLRAFGEAVLGQVAGLLGDVLTSYRTQLVEPLTRALNDASASLHAERTAEVKDLGVAQVRTDQVAAWPEAGAPVPARFSEAQNEVLLTRAEEFALRFDEHISVAVPAGPAGAQTAKDAVRVVVESIIRDQWETQAQRRTGELLIRTATWRPVSLARNPGPDGGTAQTGAGAYRLAVTPAELLQRARDWVQTPEGSFAPYLTTSMRDYVAGSELSDHVKAERQAELRTAFRKTLELARPLVAVDAEVMRAVHGGEQAVHCKFSEVPFDGLALAAELRDDVKNSGAEERSLDEFADALGTSSNATRIDVFGSYPPMAPLVFPSLLRPMAVGMTTANNFEGQFVDHRRSRRLSGAVAMSDAQRQAIIGGWYAARFTGRLRYPGEAGPSEQVEVYDPAAGAWVGFPARLLAKEDHLRRDNANLLPAVLLSFGAAMSEVSVVGTLDPLRPYTVLRRYWNDSDSPLPLDEERVDLFAAHQLVAGWLGGEAVPSGAPERYRQRSGDTEAERASLLETIRGIRETLGRDYLKTGDLGAPGGGAYSKLDRLEDLWQVPLFHEVAYDAYQVLGTLERIVAKGERGRDTGLAG
jgi:hypothetical protein